MAVMSLPPEAPRSIFRRRGWRQGCVARHGEGFAWRATRNGVKYRGPQMATRELAEAALGEALEAFDRGELPVTAPPQSSLARPRSRTIPPAQLLRLVRAEERITYPEDVERPTRREHCSEMARPCPFVSCAHHLYLDVNADTGSIKLNFPHLEVWEMSETCTLDVADRGGVTLEEVGAILGVTRERVRQIEVKGIRAIEESRESAGLSPPIDPTVYPPGGKAPRSGCP